MRSVLAALSVAIALSGAALAASPVRDTLIVPGQRVGPIALGMNAAALAEAVGVPPETLHQGNDTIYSWGQIAAQIADNSSGVDLITVNDPRYETVSHVRVGLAAPAVTAVLGQPAKRTPAPGLETLDYDGLTVIVRNNLVAQIRVRK